MVCRFARHRLLNFIGISLLSGCFIFKAETALSTSVKIIGRQLLVNEKAFIIKGVGYSPIPIGVDPEVMPPYGDYFTGDVDSKLVYNRDLPLIRVMGANTVRLWGWENKADHTDFLDRAYNNGDAPIYVIVSFWMGRSKYPDISSADARAQIKADFRSMVAAHKDHPAVLMWAIGNELNASWNYGDNPKDLFSLISEMATEAHAEEGLAYHPVTMPLADVVDLLDTISSYGPDLENLDVLSVQVYRGSTFGSLFRDIRNASSKPLAILEYGIDAYDDKRGDEYENSGTSYQATYAASLWDEILANTDVCIGGSIMAYCDEWWKGKYGQTDLNHSTCPDSASSLHTACGYSTSTHPDGYANEEWWGVMRTLDNGTQPDAMQPRAVYYTLKSLWTSKGDRKSLPYLPLLLLDD